MVVFTDGRDSDLQPKDGGGKPDRRGAYLEDSVHHGAHGLQPREGEVVRTDLAPDGRAHRRRFYAVYDEESMCARAARNRSIVTRRIDVREYSVQRPRYAGYALVAIAMWLSAAL